LVVTLSLGLAGTVQAQGEAKTILDKALQAHGGADRLAKYKATQSAGKGTVDIGGNSVEFTSEDYAQLPDQFKSVVKLQVNGMNITQVQSMNKGKLAITLNGMKLPLTDKLQELFKEEVYAERLATLLPLKDKEYELALAGEVKVDDKPAVGIKVSSKGHKDVNLYFDKENGLLVRMEFRSVDPMTEQEYTRETYFRAYKDANGLKNPTKVLINRDGKKYVEMELTEIKNLEKLDDSVFEP
jgi:hypothetical protein